MKLTRLKAVLAAALVAGAGTSAYADDAAEETVVATAEAEFWLGGDEIVVASGEKEFWLGPEGQPVGESAYVVTTAAGCYIIGEGVTTNFPAGFDRNSITSAVVADGITEIGARFFKNFNNLNAVTFGKDVTKVGEKAFLYCMSLESVEIENPNFDLSSLDGAISYHTAIKSDGSLYPIPNVTVNGCQQTLEGKAALTDANWTDLGAVDPGKSMEDYTGYHFFRIVLKKVEE